MKQAAGSTLLAAIDTDLEFASDRSNTPLLKLEQHAVMASPFESLQSETNLVFMLLSDGCRLVLQQREGVLNMTLHRQQLSLLAREQAVSGEAIDAADVVVVSLDNAFFDQVANDMAKASQLASQPQLDDPLLASICHNLYQEFQRDAVNRFYIESLALALCSHLLRRFHEIQEVVPSATSLSPTQLYTLREFIEANLANDISIESLAAICSYSPYYFSRLFKQAVGVSPYAYIVQRRMEAAKRLMRTTALPIEQIALSVGYSNPSHFSRVFRRAESITPRAFRRIYQGEKATA